MPVDKIHWQGLFLFILVIAVMVTVISDRYAFIYGVLVGLVNLGLSYGFLYWNRRRIPRWQGESLIAVVQSVVVRAMVVGGLLVFGFDRLDADNVSVVIGFVLGQFYYLFIQLVGIIKHGK